MRAKARQHKPREMNKNEAAYARELDHRQRDGKIARYRFEPMKFRLADLAFYTPDFAVQLPDGTIEFHDVKPGYRQKLKYGTRCEARPNERSETGAQGEIAFRCTTFWPGAPRTHTWAAVTSAQTPCNRPR
jgi:hypothetical protein